MSLSSSPILSVCHCTIGGRVGSQGARAGALRVMSELVPLPIGMPSPHSQQWHTFFFFQLSYLFLVVLGLCCCAWAFSSCGKWGLISSYSVRTSHCNGFSYCKAQELGMQASLVVACRLQSTGCRAQANGLSYPMACGIFPDQGLNSHPLHWQADS